MAHRVTVARPRLAVLSTVRLFHDGLVALLSNITTVDMVAVQPMSSDSMAQLSTAGPDVILAQVTSREDAQLVRSALEQLPEAQLIAMGLPDIDEVIVACAQAGAAGYVGADATLDELMAAIDAVIHGKPATPPSVTAALLRHVASVADGSDDLVSSLTGREREVLHCLVEGMSNKGIAQRLHIEVSTVKNHIHNILQELRVHRRAEAADVIGRR